MKKLCVWAVAALLMAACTPKAEKATDSGLLQSKFQTEVDGKKTDLFTLRNKNNMEVCITNFGGRIVSVMVPDKVYQQAFGFRCDYRTLCQSYQSGTVHFGWCRISASPQ